MAAKRLIGGKIHSQLFEMVEQQCTDRGLNITQGLTLALTSWVDQGDADLALALAIANGIIDNQNQIITEFMADRREARQAAAKAASPDQGQGYPAKADGKRWLTASAAYCLAIERGINRPRDAALAWMRKNPEECLDQTGLRYVKNPSKSPISTRWQDMRYSPGEGEEDLDLARLTAEVDTLVAGLDSR
jgi:hypothetical protein